MSKLPKPIRWTLRVLVLFAVYYLAWILWMVWDAKREPNLIISCRNHGNQIYGSLLVEANENPGWRLPFLPSADGAMVFAAYGRRVGGHANCNHGAPNQRIGGWQAVGLTPEKWDEVFLRWPEGSADDGVPLYWCGRPSSKNERFMVTVRSRTNFWISHATEEKLAERVGRLNQLLVAMSERPVSLNVPDKVDWDKAPLWPTNSSASRADAMNSPKQASVRWR